MIRTLFYTVFCDDEDKQTLEMIARGDLVYLTLTRKIHGGDDSDYVFSERTKNTEEAFRRYFIFAQQFAEGDYSWEDRKYLVSTAFNDLND